MGLIDRLRSYFSPYDFSGIDPSQVLNFNGNTYSVGFNQTLVGHEEKPLPGFVGLVDWAYMSNPVVFACVRARVSLFSEARFQFRQVRNGRPGDLFGTQELGVLEVPWPNGVTGDLLARMLQDADLAGNAFIYRRGDTLVRLRPDWVTIILGSDADPSVEAWDLRAEVLGYSYQEGGYAAGKAPVFLLREQVAHFAPTPDPLAPYRGMSWLTPLIREIAADSAATTHKLKFFENGATPNMVVSLDPNIQKAAFDQWVETFRKGHEGLRNAYRTIYLGGGAKVEVIGKDLQQVEFKTTQGAGETRIAAAAGVPPIIVGLSEGLAAATYSNYGQARRAFSDLTMRNLWRNVCGSLATIVAVPGGAELWYDDRDIAFLQDDMMDRASIQSVDAQAIKTLIDAGFEAQTAVDAITANDLTRLSHTGLFSVQLQAPGSTKMPTGEVPGMVPVGPGTAPEMVAPPTPARDLLMDAADRRAEAMDRRIDALTIRPEVAPSVTVNVPEQPVTVIIERGAVEVSAPVAVTTPDIQVINADAVEMDSSLFAAAVAAE